MARLIDADRLREYYNVTDPAGTFAYCDSILTCIDNEPTVDAIPVEWLREKMRGYASTLKSTEMDAVVRVMEMWEKEQEAQDAKM